jgi:hypothetical protein
MVIFDQVYDERGSSALPFPLLVLLLGRVRKGPLFRALGVLPAQMVRRPSDGARARRGARDLCELCVVGWLRALGMRIGRRAEISTATAITHDLVEIGEDAFVAADLRDVEIRRGVLTLCPTVIGCRTCLGNASCVPDGSAMPDECLVGCLSVPPDGGALQPGQTCLGMPAVILPSRQFSATMTRCSPSGRARAASRRGSR